MAKHVMLTGSPGIGKTTAVKKVCAILKQKGVVFQGFYTEEMREGHRRIGFNVVTTNEMRGPLARESVEGMRGPKVGKYTVDVASFEQLALPTLNVNKPGIVVVDEIGKMELFSQAFKDTVRKIFTLPEVRILATVPIARGHPLAFVDEIKNREDVTVITVTKENRNNVVNQIVELLTS